MRKLKLIYYVLYSAMILAVIGIDQLTKLLATRFLKPIDTQPIINEVLHLTYAENRGAAFGILSEHRWVFMTVSTFAILLLLFVLYSGFLGEGRLYSVAISLIIGGGIGNMIDRIFLGYVVDFIDFRLIDFAIFNGADSAVCIGAGLLLLAVILEGIKEKKQTDKKENNT